MNSVFLWHRLPADEVEHGQHVCLGPVSAAIGPRGLNTVTDAALHSGSARASRAGDGALAIADFSSQRASRRGAAMSTRGRVRSPDLLTALHCLKIHANDISNRMPIAQRRFTK